MYYEGVKAFKQSFNDVKIILFEDFIKDPNKEVNGITKFLEIEDYKKPVELIKMNVSGKRKYPLLYNIKKTISLIIIKNKKPPALNFLKKPFKWINKLEPLTMEKDERRILKKIFKPEILRLSKVLKKDLLKIWT